ncbi:MAG: efflux RND transporter periplasmic adaptor subunit [Myxococcales bacterium]|nr:efflux RND transporter periplasmic adaptor subunit [Myxococcales bacterium]
MALKSPAPLTEVTADRPAPDKPTVAPLPPPQRMSWKGRLFAVVFVLAIAGITVASVMPKPQPPVEVQAISSRQGTITRIVTAGGKLQAATQVKLSSNITGDLLTLTVKEGDVVKKGQELGTIDPRRYAAQVSQFEAARASAVADVQQAKVQVAQLEAELKRVEKLQAGSIASAAEVEKATSELLAGRARFEAANGRLSQTDASLREARHSFSMTTLTAPIDGVVTKREKQVGERVRGSDFSEDVILIISTLSQMEMKMEVGEQEVVYLKEGQSAEVEVDALPGQKFRAEVVEVARNANVKNAGTEGEVTTFFVRLAMTEKDARALPGMSAQASVFTDTRDDAVVVPIQAVTVRSEKELPGSQAPKPETSVPPAAGGRKAKREPMQKVVFVIEDGVAKIRRVETGLASDTEIEIVTGLAAGERVVEGPYRVLSRELSDGKPVKEQGEESKGERPAG